MASSSKESIFIGLMVGGFGLFGAAANFWDLLFSSSNAYDYLQNTIGLLLGSWFMRMGFEIWREDDLEDANAVNNSPANSLNTDK